MVCVLTYSESATRARHKPLRLHAQKTRSLKEHNKIDFGRIPARVHGARARENTPHWIAPVRSQSQCVTHDVMCPNKYTHNHTNQQYARKSAQRQQQRSSVMMCGRYHNCLCACMPLCFHTKGSRKSVAVGMAFLSMRRRHKSRAHQIRS